tara:strand:+ start:57 stop:401 length:345 start_codon:yes stop_codon:yes gene_type:complete
MNPKRGEVELEFGGKVYTGRVTLDVVMRIETALGKSIIEQLKDLSDAQTKLTEMVNIITPVIRAGGNDLKDKEVADLIWQGGITNSMRMCAAILTKAVNPFEAESGNAEEVDKD